MRDNLRRLFPWKKEGGQMPRKPKKPCAYPGCPNLTEGRYCPEHQMKVNSEYEKYGRDPRTKKRYGRAWKRIRDKYVMEHPFCELCFQRGVIVPVEEVHHKKPLSEGGTHDRSNLIALCKSCHSRIHAERGDRWGKHPEGEENLHAYVSQGTARGSHAQKQEIKRGITPAGN